MSKIILIVGPTAVGKTRLSIELAKYYNAQIINADSTQIYKEPNIATAKIKEEEKDGIIHHLIDIKSLSEDYTIYDFQKDGREILDELISKNINVIIVGGSGLYVKALLYNYNLESENDNSIDLSNYTNSELKNMADSIYESNNIHTNNRKRLERFISYYKNTGNIIQTTSDVNKRMYEFISIGLNTDRETLYKRINDRVEVMFKEGLLDEAERLYKKNYKNYSYIIGYRELIDYFNNKISLEEAKELIKKDTRHYAKRQLTWFKRQMDDVKWFDVDFNNFDNTINEIKKFLD